MSNGVILLKRPYISSNIAPTGSECEKNLQEVIAWESEKFLKNKMAIMANCLKIVKVL